MTIQEIPSWGHPGLDFNNAKALLWGISSLVLMEMSVIIIVELHFITQSVSI